MTGGGQHPKENWLSIFEDRGYLRLDEPKLQAWMDVNRTLFDALSTLYANGKTVLDIGSGPGRHACGAAHLGYQVLGIELDPEMVTVATGNARLVTPDADITFHNMDLADIESAFADRTFDVVLHGGLLEHFPTAAQMRAELRRHLRLAANVVFDVPIRTARNEALFSSDSVFRHVWEADQWLTTVLAEFKVVQAKVELRTDPGMTDDLVVWLKR